MGMTMTEKILAQHAGRDAVQAGDLLVAQVDLVLANDITGPPAIAEFEKIGRPVFDKDKIALVPDHFSPCKDIKSATMCKRMRDFARQHEITNYFEVGRMGIEHALLPDSGLVAPGEIIIGADSHTCTYGALNALSTGMGQTDIGAAMASGTTWFKVPATIKVELTGKLPKYVKGKDIILTLIGMIGVDGARYQSLEFCGDGVATLSVEERMTITNMVIELGGKCGLMPCDDTLREWLHGRVEGEIEGVAADDDAVYCQTVEVDLDKLCPQVAKPHKVDNVSPIAEVEGTPVQHAIIGTCTNGRIEDLEVAARILDGKKIAHGMTLTISPASKAVYIEAIHRGYVETFLRAGATIAIPGCSGCSGGAYVGIPADGEAVITTANRNFKGRLGNANSFLYLASPATVAASALTGCIEDSRNYVR